MVFNRKVQFNPVFSLFVDALSLYLFIYICNFQSNQSRKVVLHPQYMILLNSRGTIYILYTERERCGQSAQPLLSPPSAPIAGWQDLGGADRDAINQSAKRRLSVRQRRR